MTSHNDEPLARAGSPIQPSWLDRVSDVLPGGPRRAADRQRRDRAHALYMTAVRSARTVYFYQDLAVPDSENGRFEMIILHLVILMRALRRFGSAGKALAQESIDLFVSDMDRSLREGGVGDLSVGKRVKQMAGCYHARASVLEEPLNDGKIAAVGEVILHNLYGDDPARGADSQTMARYLKAQDEAMAALPRERLFDDVLDTMPIDPAAV